MVLDDGRFLKTEFALSGEIFAFGVWELGFAVVVFWVAWCDELCDEDLRNSNGFQRLQRDLRCSAVTLKLLGLRLTSSVLLVECAGHLSPGVTIAGVPCLANAVQLAIICLTKSSSA